DGAPWQALAQWYADNGREDEALAVRVFWPTLRDNLTFASLEATLADAVRNSKMLAELAREVERRAREEPAEFSFGWPTPGDGVVGAPSRQHLSSPVSRARLPRPTDRGACRGRDRHPHAGPPG